MACVSACPKNCIKINKDKYGFLHPEIDKDDCIDCKKCDRSCPMVSDVLSYKQKLQNPLVYAAWYRKGRENE